MWLSRATCCHTKTICQICGLIYSKLHICAVSRQLTCKGQCLGLGPWPGRSPHFAVATPGNAVCAVLSIGLFQNTANAGLGRRLPPQEFFLHKWQHVDGIFHGHFNEFYTRKRNSSHAPNTMQIWDEQDFDSRTSSFFFFMETWSNWVTPTLRCCFVPPINTHFEQHSARDFLP